MRRTSATMQKVGAMPLRREQSRRSLVKASLTISELSCRCFQHFPPTSSGGPFGRPCFVRTAETARVLRCDEGHGNARRHSARRDAAAALKRARVQMPAKTRRLTQQGTAAAPAKRSRPADRPWSSSRRSARTTARRSVSGRPRQFWVMWQNSRCSILFHFDVPGG